MRKNIFVINIIIVCNILLSSQISGIDLLDYNFFNFTMNQSFNEVVASLKKGKQEFSVSTERDSMFKEIFKERGTMQNGFYIRFYNDKIRSIDKFNVDNQYIDNLLLENINFINIPHYDNKSTD